MSSSDPDISALVDAVKTSPFGPMTKDAMNDMLLRASKCNGGQNDDATRFQLISAVRFQLSEPERWDMAFSRHQLSCARVGVVERTLAGIEGRVVGVEKKISEIHAPSNDIEFELPSFLGGKKVKFHGVFAQTILVFIVSCLLAFLLVKVDGKQQNELKATLNPIKAALKLPLDTSGDMK